MVNHTFLRLLFFFTFLGLGGLAYWSVQPKDGPIILGASLPLTGINKELGTEVVAGANAWFEHVNATGGIKGRKIEFIYYDDKYEPQNTAHNLQKLLYEDQAFALFGFVGTPTIKKILPEIMLNKLPLIASYTGASFLRDASAPNIVNFRTSYQEEINALVEHLHTSQGLTRFAIFYQNDIFGEEGYIATVNALGTYSLSLVGEGTYKRNTLSIRHALHEIQSSSPEAIIVVGAYKPSAHFIQQAKENGMNTVIFCPISFVNADALVAELSGKTKNILFSQVVPSYDPKASAAALEYTRLLERYAPLNKPSLASFESFLAAKALTLALKRVDDPLTRGKLLTTLNNQTFVDLGDIPMRFSHLYMHASVYLSVYEEGFHIIHRKSF
ncbi:ABC transporter substrate-binding protein [Sulfurospirillum sp. T05]|uniref:ABC transporter substrate-binding protein n=1 Tax=Sulfurospirillum tamanense TaxID=2813362 RepID=A0ABS2WP51_9BACT|nr:ABC transporter substrate-binding protein [Sulfurospirillum tamanensis]MBN2963347.1 ABC transporter substrate-binding protein [Sulfurospirillum tamanensis]